MKRFESVLLTALLFVCVLQAASAIKCWDCRSDNDPKCGDPFDNSTLAITDCAQAPELEHLPGVRPTMCRKIRQKVHGEWRYFRSCAYMGEPGIEGDERFCLMRAGSFDIFMEYCTCNKKDGCNSASFLGAGTLPMLMVLLGTFFASGVAHLLRQ